MSVSGVFHPVSRRDFTGELSENQRYRHAFNDYRLQRRFTDVLCKLEESRCSVINRFSATRDDQIAAYRFFNNDKVSLPELIHQVCDIDSEHIRDQDLYVPIDGSSCNLSLGVDGRKDWVPLVGVIGNNFSPGFSIMPSLVLNANNRHCYGLGDILFHSREKAKGSAAENKKLRNKRKYLPLHDKESGAWSIVAKSTAAQLETAHRVTFIMDQGADNYESLALIHQQTKRDFIVRSKNNRTVRLQANRQIGTIQELLAQTSVISTRKVKIKALNHKSKTSGRDHYVKRKSRLANIALKVIDVELCLPSDYPKDKVVFKKTLRLVQALEDPCTVPLGEDPIHWILLTSWPVENVAAAWKVIEAYQYRWDIEQLFRILKTQGYNVEQSQLNHPDRIKKLVTMALKASTRALTLVAARDGEEHIDVETVFSIQEVKALHIMHRKYEGTTAKTTNPFKSSSLAWAAWIVARAGGWKGYRSQRPPGPITMTRGLFKLQIICDFMDIDHPT